MKTSYITALFLAISLPVFAGETSATFVQDQDHAFDQPTNLTLSNFFTDGWDQAWTQRDTPDGAPDLALFHGDTAFLERDLRMDYSSEEYTPGDRSIRTLDGSIAYAFNRRIMLEAVSDYVWKEYHSGSAQSGGNGTLEARIQLVDVPGAAYAFKLSASEPNHGLGSHETEWSYGFGGWNDLTRMGYGKVGVYYSIEGYTYAGPAATDTRRNDIGYTVALAKTWTAPDKPLFGDFTTFAELYGGTNIDGKPRGNTSLDITPGVRFDVGRGNILMAGVDLPLTWPHQFEAVYRLTYIMYFDGKGSPAGQNQLSLAQSNNWTNWHLPYWHFSLTEGWDSQYIFRGEDLTPGAAGFFTSDLQASTPGFARDQTLTLGVLGGLQMGEADYAGFPPTIRGTQAAGPELSHLVHSDRYFKEAIWTHQKSYRELDLSAKYKFNIGSYLVAETGDILYFSEYDASTTQYLIAPHGFHFLATGTKYLTNGYSHNADGEDRNDIYLSLRPNPSLCRYNIVPSLTYFETFNEQKSYDAFFEQGSHSTYENGRFQKIDAPAYGGYLEGRVDGCVSLLRKNGADIFTLRPYALLSVSFNDATEAAPNFGRKYFTGWNDTEIGVETPYVLNKYVTVSAHLACTHSLTTPDQSTSRNEVWAGAKVTVTF